MGASSDRWEGRPIVAGLLRGFVTLAPIAIAIVSISLLSKVVPRPGGWGPSIAWWIGLSAFATLALLATDRIFRRLVPVIALFQLSLVFPDRAPSRFKTALRTGTVNQLKRKIQSGEYSRAAPQDAAEQLVNLASTLNAHDRLTRGHTERVRAYSVMIGEEMGLESHELELLNWAGLVHDIGKLAVPAEILTKAGAPSKSEWAILRDHPAKADALVEPLRPWLGEWAESATQHHEYFDGNGYPNGLVGSQISRAGRIVAVADAYDVMTSVRSYKKAMPASAARQELAVNAGTQFDPVVVRAFLTLAIGRLRLVAGPLGSLIQLPAGSASLGSAAATGASAVTTMTVAALTGLIGPPIPELPAPAPPAAVAMVADAPDLEFVGSEDQVIQADLGRLLGEPGASVKLLVEPTSGTVEVSADGVVSFVPNANFNGSVVLPYSVCFDGAGCAEGSLTLQIQPVNDAPAAIDDEVTIPEGGIVNYDVVANDSDLDGDLLNVVLVARTEDAAHRVVPTALSASDRRVVVEFDENDNGTLLLEYSVADPFGAIDQANLLINITPVNDSPVAVDDSAQIVENTSAVIDVLGNDSDVDLDSLLITSVASVRGGTATTDGQTVTFLPTPRYVGSGSFTYTIGDGAEGSASARVTINIVDDVDRPGLGNDIASSTEDSAVLIDVAANDTSVGGAFAAVDLAVVRTPSNGTATLAGGEISYEPDANWSGVDTFDYYVCDLGDYCSTATVTVTVAPVNDRPSFTPGAAPIVLGNSGEHRLPDWATSLSAGPADEAAQTMSFAVVASNPSLFSVLPSISSSGELSFTTAADTNGVSAITIVLSDSGGVALGGIDVSPSISSTITITAVNDPPFFTAGPGLAIAEDSGPRIIPGWATGIAPGPPDESSQTLSFTVVASDPSLFAALPAISPSGELSFTPAAEANGVSTLAITLSDSGGTALGGVDTSPPVTATITIDPVNDAPSFNDAGLISAVPQSAGPQTVAAWASGMSAGPPDETGQALSFVTTSNSNPTLFTTAPTLDITTGDISFAAAFGVSGTANLVFVLVDDGGTASGGQDTSVDHPVTVTVTSNLPPTAAVGGPYLIAEGGSLVLDASGSSDPETDPLNYEWDLSYDGISFNVEATGATPSLSWSTLQGLGVGDDGAFTVGVRVFDGVGNFDVATGPLTVANVAPALSIAGSGSAEVGVPYALSLASFEPGADTISSWRIDWGDGTIEIVAGNPPAVSHNYQNAGMIYNVIVSATDEDGTWFESDLLVTSAGDPVYRFDGLTAAFEGSFGNATTVGVTRRLHIGTDGLLYVSGSSTDNVERFDPSTGVFIDTFVVPGSGGLSGPGGAIVGPDRNLYVSSDGGDSVLQYDGSTGAFIGSFVASGSGGLDDPTSLGFGPDGNLYVISGSDELLRFDGASGAFIDTFVTSGLNGPTDFTWGPDGSLYVANTGAGTVTRYDGATGAPLGTFVSAGSGGLVAPVGLAFGPDGKLYVVDTVQAGILRFDGASGAFVDQFVPSAANGLAFPAALVFTPDHQVKVALGATSGNFNATGLNLGGGRSHDVVSGDFDGDGDPDLAFANEAQGNTVYTNWLFGIMVNSGQSLGTARTLGVATGDVDGDGDLDLVYAVNDGADTVWLNDGSGTFTDSGQTIGTANTTDVTLADLDGDGDLDLAYAYLGQGNTIWFNDGSGSFTDSGQSFGTAPTRGVSAADLDGDTDIDLVFSNDGAGDTVWLNDGAGSFTDTGQSLGIGRTNDAALRDLDADGDVDILFAGDNEGDTVWLNDGLGVFTDSGQILGLGHSRALEVADLDGDGDLDVMFGDHTGANSVWFNDGTGVFVDSTQRLGNGSTEGIALADGDGDGDLGAYTANDGEPNRAWQNSAP